MKFVGTLYLSFVIIVLQLFVFSGSIEAQWIEANSPEAGSVRGRVAKNPMLSSSFRGKDNTYGSLSSGERGSITIDTFAVGIPHPWGIAVSNGGDYGNYIYVTSGSWQELPNTIYRISPSGSYEVFATAPSGNGTFTQLVFDRTPDKKYGGYLYVVINYVAPEPCLGGVSRILPDGTIQTFMNGCGIWPTWVVGPHQDLVIDDIGNFGNIMLLGDAEADPSWSSNVYQISQAGSYSLYYNIHLYGIYSAELDRFGKFNNDIIVSNIIGAEYEEGDNAIYRLSPGGIYSSIISDLGYGYPGSLAIDQLGVYGGKLLVQYPNWSSLCLFDSLGTMTRRFYLPNQTQIGQDIEGSFDYDFFATSTPQNVVYRLHPDSLAALFGYVFDDLNSNGAWDSGESSLPGVRIYLKDSLGVIVNSTYSHQDGCYLFQRIHPGKYTVVEEPFSGWVTTVPQSGSYSLTVGFDQYFTQYDFGHHRTSTIYCDFSNPDTIKLGNASYYEFGIRKSNGSIAYIQDKTTGQIISRGSRYECLWGASISAGPSNYVGGCSYNSGWGNRFSYSWNPYSNILMLTYTPDSTASQKVNAVVTVSPTDSAWLDMQLSLQNQWGYALDQIHFPSDLVFLESEIQEALLPMLPGVILQQEFFTQHRTYGTNYPGWGVFADYLHVRTSGGNFAEYTMSSQDHVQPLYFAFNHDDGYLPGSTFLQHSYGARIHDDSLWNSPVVRIRISQPMDQTIQSLRGDNGIDNYPSLAEKLSSRYNTLVQSPLFKADAVQLNTRFSNYPIILNQLPTPGMLHPVAFQPRGFDENYPDFLPPNANFGTTSELETMFQYAKTLGLMVMPYTNPTWWDNQSPTIQTLPGPLTIDSIAVINDSHAPWYEYYGSKGGYVVSPYVQFVRQRVDQLVNQMTTEVSSDFVFEDQVGARSLMFDNNPVSPTPTSYIDGWLLHAGTHPNLLMTEMGFDRLAKSMVGFHGSVLLSERLGYTASWWGNNTWHPYPMSAMILRDKVLNYQHDLATETMTKDKKTLTWNLAYGLMLSYDIVTGGLANSWLNVTGDFQEHVLSRYASVRMTGFTNLTVKVTLSDFSTCAVTANWDSVNTFTQSGQTISASGAMVSSYDGNLRAGIFTKYNGTPLSSGDHCIIEQRDTVGITVRHPLGTDTYLRIMPLSGWGINAAVDVRAYNAKDSIITILPSHFTPDSVSFTFVQNVGGHKVAYVRIEKTSGLKLAVKDRWNIISIPTGVGETSVSVLFPTAISSAYRYQGSYQAVDHLDLGTGYWLKFPSSQTIDIPGYAINNDTVEVFEGWNIIGSVSKAIAVNAIGSEPAGMTTSSFFDYNNGYVNADSIIPGKGYWVKVDRNGLLILAAGTNLKASNRVSIVPTSEFPPQPPDGQLSDKSLPKDYVLEQNYPNPFNPNTTILYGLPAESKVSLKIFNVLGQVVEAVTDRIQKAGYNTFEWNASGVPSGLYFYRLVAASVSEPAKHFSQTRKMVLVK
jgi:hypothetical protein